MNIKDQMDFLALSDFEKVRLKLSYSKFINYRMMTKEQELQRRHKINTIASHYGKIPFEDLALDQAVSLNTAWPKYLERYVTPRLLDLFSTEWFCQFGYCYFCNHFDGYNKAHYKYFFARNSKSKIITFSGKCTNSLVRSFDDEESNWRTLRKGSFVSPTFCCHLWEPMELYINIIQLHIFNKLKNKKHKYNMKDYANDLHNVYFWNYFLNVYETPQY